MKTHVGIFNSQIEALVAYKRLRAAGIEEKELVLLTPHLSERGLEQVPTEDGEQPGMGKAIGGVVGSAVGLSAGATLASLLLPAVGPIVAIGLGAAPLGIGGAVAGAAIFLVSQSVNIISPEQQRALTNTNPYNVVRATINALEAVNSPADIAAKRGKTVEDILGA